MTRPFAPVALGAFVVAAVLAAAPALAQPEGTISEDSPASYQEMIDRLDAAVKDHDMAVVTRASATVGVKKVFDEEIPGNMVVGVFHPRFARQMLEASVPAGIEAPIRFYIVENPDGGSTLAYRKPTAVFEPWSEGNEALQNVAIELDAVFGGIFAEATE